jgi:hypothetical protein
MKGNSMFYSEIVVTEVFYQMGKRSKSAKYCEEFRAVLSFCE